MNEDVDLSIFLGDGTLEEKFCKAHVVEISDKIAIIEILISIDFDSGLEHVLSRYKGNLYRSLILQFIQSL